MPSIAPTPRSTPPSLPSQDPLQKKSHNLLTKSNKKAIQAWAKTNPAATWKQIQAYIRNNFGVTYAKGTIHPNKKAWGFTVKARAQPPVQPLKPDEVKTLKEWAKTHKAATWKQIQSYIKNTFGVTYTKGSIVNYKKKWEFTVRAYARPLKSDEVKTLKAWAKINPTTTYARIQAYIRDSFGLEYSEGKIQKNRKAWGVTIAKAGALEKKAHARVLKPHEVKTLKEWAKTHKAATWKQIQAYIRNNFEVTYAEASIREHKKAWGFAVKTYARNLIDNEVSKLRAWAKEHPNATNTEIQTYIKEIFNSEYSETSIKRHKVKWGFILKSQDRSLTNEEVNPLKDWAKEHTRATFKEIQAYIRDTFNVEYSKTSIQKYKAEWGFTVQAHRGLCANQISTLKDWAKEHAHATWQQIQAHIKNTFKIRYTEKHVKNNKKAWGFAIKTYARNLTDNEVSKLRAWAKTNKTATWKQIQAHIKNTFRVEYLQARILRHKAKWGFAVKAPKASDNNALATDLYETNLNEFLSSFSLPENEDENFNIDRATPPLLEDFEFDIHEDLLSLPPVIVQAKAHPIVRSLQPDEVNKLRDWAETHKAATNAEIQAYIKDTFGVEYAENSIRGNRKAWGFSVET